MKTFPWFTLALTATIILAACNTTSNLKKEKLLPPPPAPKAQMSFQFNQHVTLQMLNEDPALTNAFLTWVDDGLYSNTPVYRQLPGIFILTGKPRLKGAGFTPGTIATPDPKGKPAKEATAGYAGLVIHADGTVGPELVLTYGHCFLAKCESPANIRIAKITEGQGTLQTIQRGDNLINIAIQSK